MPSVQTLDSKALHEHHVTELAEKVEVQIDKARTALWAAHTLLKLLEKEAKDEEKQRELVEIVSEAVEQALSHLTEDVPAACLVVTQLRADLVSAMVSAFYNRDDDEEGAR